MYLEDVEQAAPLIQLGISLAREASARVRGLTLVDTREVEASLECESAIYLSMASTRNAISEHTQAGAREELSKACLDAGLNFDVRRQSGNPLDILPRESRFHDLILASARVFGGRTPHTLSTTLSASDLEELVKRGVQPLMLLPPTMNSVRRVLLVYDGSEAAGRAIRTYFGLGVLKGADHRLLSVGGDENDARAALAEMAEYCLSHCRSLETGLLVGKPGRVVASYAAKWQADLVVLGVERRRWLLHRTQGRATLDSIRALQCGIFVQA